MASNLLVTGGAGYIGSHMVKALVGAGHAVTVFDNLCNGHADAVRGAPLVRGDLRNRADIEGLLGRGNFDAVLHFAAFCYVGESMQKPREYYENNVVGTLHLLDAMRAAGVRRLVFSSSCATYGNPQRLPMDETHPQQPVSPYGVTKFAAERAIADYGAAYGLRAIALRYYNAAGCDPEGELGERHEPETHLIPLVLREAMRVTAGGRAEDTALRINGEDFDTADGTCVRDYVHISDLCAAHLLAFDRLRRHGDETFEAFNLGNGKGFSIKEVVAVCREVTGADIRYAIGARRPGDPPALVADARKAREVLGWQPRFDRLQDIVRTQWDWMRARAGA